MAVEEPSFKGSAHWAEMSVCNTQVVPAVCSSLHTVSGQQVDFRLERLCCRASSLLKCPWAKLFKDIFCHWSPNEQKKSPCGVIKCYFTHCYIVVYMCIHRVTPWQCTWWSSSRPQCCYRDYGPKASETQTTREHSVRTLNLFFRDAPVWSINCYQVQY